MLLPAVRWLAGGGPFLGYQPCNVVHIVHVANVNVVAGVAVVAGLVFQVLCCCRSCLSLRFVLLRIYIVCHLRQMIDHSKVATAPAATTNSQSVNKQNVQTVANKQTLSSITNDNAWALSAFVCCLTFPKSVLFLYSFFLFFIATMVRPAIHPSIQASTMSATFFMDSSALMWNLNKNLKKSR